MRNDGSFQGEWGDRAPRSAIVVAKHNAYSGMTSEADKRACVKAATQRARSRAPAADPCATACLPDQVGRQLGAPGQRCVLDARTPEPLRFRNHRAVPGSTRSEIRVVDAVIGLEQVQHESRELS